MEQLTLREIPDFLPPWAFACAGRPDERRARQEARRCFTQLKMGFTRVAAEPIELWMLQGSLLAGLPPDHPRGEEHRKSLQEALACAFPPRRSQGQPGSQGN